MKELEKIADSNGELLEIVDAEAREDISEIKQSLSDLETLEKTVSGAIVTFDDGSDLSMPKLEVAIEPVQDLHGYDAPWVGGSGKNKFDQTTWQYYNVSRKTNATNIPSMVTLLNSLPVGYYTISAKFKVDTVEATQTTRNYGFFITTTGSYLPENYTRVDNPTVGSVYSASITVNKSSADMEFSAVYIYAGRGTVTDTATIYDMQLESGQTATAYAPYSNICPISGWDDVNVTVCDDIDNPTVTHTYTIDLDGTRYGGTLDVVSGLLTITDGYIASYNSETLPSTWISDRDVYTEGTTPTVGAEVVYKLATSQTIQLTPTQVNSLLGVNNIWADTGDIKELIYFRNTNSTQAIKDIINTITAEDIAINTPDEMTATNVQEAIDEHTEMLAEQGEDISEIKQSLSNLSDNRYYRKFVSTNFPTTSLSNGNYFYAIIDTEITTANYDLCSYVVWTNKWQMPMFLKIDTDRLSDTNYILRLNASKTDFPSYNDLSGSPITVLVVYKAKVS